MLSKAKRSRAGGRRSSLCLDCDLVCDARCRRQRVLDEQFSRAMALLGGRLH